MFDLQSQIEYLEEKHKTESDKETTNDDLISSIETLISDKKTDYEALGGTYDRNLICEVDNLLSSKQM